MREVNCVIIGGGIAGMACALSLANQGIDDVVLIEREPYLGGILNQNIHLGYGKQTFKKDLSGPLFAQCYEQLLKRTRIEVMSNCYVHRIDKNKEVSYISEKGYGCIQAKSIVMACGGLEKPFWLMAGGLRGIYSALAAQSLINLEGMRIGERIVILGGGDSACILARRLSLEGMEVVGIVERMEEGKACNRLKVQCIDEFSIPYYCGCEITELMGVHRIEGVKLSDGLTIACDTLISASGLLPNLNLLRPLMSNISVVKVDEGYQTQLDGIFICGNNLHIHHDVDSVIVQAAHCAKGVSCYLVEEQDEDMVPIRFDGEFEFVYPQRIHRRRLEEFQLFVQVNRKNVQEILVEADQTLIKTVYKSKIDWRSIEVVNCSLKDLQVKEIRLSLRGVL